MTGAQPEAGTLRWEETSIGYWVAWAGDLQIARIDYNSDSKTKWWLDKFSKQPWLDNIDFQFSSFDEAKSAVQSAWSAWLARAALSAAVPDLLAENTRLRAALAQSKGACVYCSLPAEEWARCQSGFPGCARGDDALGCPELGARMEADGLRARVAELEAALRGMLAHSCVSDTAPEDKDADDHAVERLARAVLAKQEGG